VDLAPSSERHPSYRIDPRRSASHGIRPRVCPTFDIPVVRPLPGFVGLSRHCRSARVLPRTRTRSALVVSHHLDGLLRTQASGLLHPEAERGSLRFAMPPPPSAGRSHRSWAGAPFPATRFTPFEEFPSSAAVPRRRGRCPPAVAADNASSRTPKRTFLRTAVPVVALDVSRTTEAVSATSSHAAFRASLRSRSLEICSERPATAGMRSLPCPSLPCGPGRAHRPVLRGAPGPCFLEPTEADPNPRAELASELHESLRQRAHTSVGQTRTNHSSRCSPLGASHSKWLATSRLAPICDSLASLHRCLLGSRSLPKRCRRPQPHHAAGCQTVPAQDEPAAGRGPASGAASFRALLHRRVRSVASRCQPPTPYPSMGFVPLRGSFSPPPFQRRARGAPPLRPSLLRFHAPGEPGSLPSQSVRRVR